MNFQSLTTSPRSEATFHDFRSRHHSRSAITQLAAGFYYFFLFFFLHLGETLSRMGSSTIFQRSYSKTRTFSNFRSSRFIPHPPSLLLVLAIEIKSASITTVPLLKNDEVTLLFFLFFFCFLFFVFFPSLPTTSPRAEYLLERLSKPLPGFEIDFCKLSTAKFVYFTLARVYHK